MTPLGIGEHMVADSVHIAHFYRTIDESLGAGIFYLRKGVSRGENILIVSTCTRLPSLLVGLEDLGFPVSQLIDGGIIVTDTGRGTSSEQFMFMAEAIQNRDSTKGLRLLGDMTWALEKKWSLDDLTTLEDYTNNSLADKNKLFLCQYDLKQFRDSTAMMALDTHSHIAYRSDLTKSPYFSKAV